MPKKPTRASKKPRRAAQKPTRSPKASSTPKGDRSPPRRHDFTGGLHGWITHTDLASRDPAATKAWCAKVLGWTFKPSFPGARGEYHLFVYSPQGGGGIRSTDPEEPPGSLPYVHVADAAATFAEALQAGAEAMMPPTRVMEGVTLAIVRAPGGVPIGLSGP
jgi:predicted enzyme related to lactoylglutathione lyase